jgi:nicotinic acid phosphoribosyltransferase
MTTSSLATDAYKFSMAQAGFPLRRETFYFSFRRGGVQFIPLDLENVIFDLVAGLTVDAADLAFTRENGYGLSDAMEAALTGGPGGIEVQAVPPRTWVLEREPIFSITGPSFLVSWLEPMLLWLNYPIQLATAMLGPEDAPPGSFVATCAEHATIIERVADDIGVSKPSITIEEERYRDGVRAAVRELIAAAGTADRIFEVGMRSAVCTGQHRIALEACKEEGVVQTSNVALARELGLKPVGTMGHEHVQRWGSDLRAFEAMRDMRSSPPSYLLDTFDTMGSGIKAAVQVMRQREHPCSIRYDSGNKFIQYLHACELLQEAGLQPAHVLEDSLDVAATVHFESLREFTQWPAEKQLYGYGGSIVAGPMTNPLTRDRVSAVFKLTETGDQPRMKFGNERGLGKQSVPGRPVVWRRLRGQGPLGVIGQQGEPVPEDYVLLSGNPDAREQLRLCNVLELERAHAVPDAQRRNAHSPQTEALIARVRESVDGMQELP